MIATIFNIATGAIRAKISSPDIETVLLNIGEGEGLIEGDHDPASVYILNGTPTPLPPRPGDWAIWDGGAWIDPRTPADLTADLNRRRNAANKDKAELILIMASLTDALGLPVFSDADIEASINGDIPPSLLASVATLPPGAVLAARAKWKIDNRINRMNPVILAAAYAKGISDETLDLAFGV